MKSNHDTLGPTKERAKKAKGLIEEGVNFTHTGAGRDRDNEATVLHDSNPLMKLHKRGVISDKQFDVGEKYYQNYYLSGLFPSVTPSYSGMVLTGQNGGGMASTEKQVNNYQEYNIARLAIGSVHAGALSKMVLFGHEPWEYRKGRKDRQTAQASGVDALMDACDALIHHYGM